MGRLMVTFHGSWIDLKCLHIDINIGSSIFIGLTLHENTTYSVVQVIILLVSPTIQHEITMYTRCRNRVLCCHSNVVSNKMTIKLVDRYSSNHVEGHE